VRKKRFKGDGTCSYHWSFTCLQQKCKTKTLEIKSTVPWQISVPYTNYGHTFNTCSRRACCWFVVILRRHRNATTRTVSSPEAHSDTNLFRSGRLSLIKYGMNMTSWCKCFSRTASICGDDTLPRNCKQNKWKLFNKNNITVGSENGMLGKCNARLGKTAYEDLIICVLTKISTAK
jgi:hypothetical protein